MSCASGRPVRPSQNPRVADPSTPPPPVHYEHACQGITIKVDCNPPDGNAHDVKWSWAVQSGGLQSTLTVTARGG